MELKDIMWVVLIGIPAIAGIVVNYFANREEKKAKAAADKDSERH